MCAMYGIFYTFTIQILVEHLRGKALFASSWRPGTPSPMPPLPIDCLCFIQGQIFGEKIIPFQKAGCGVLSWGGLDLSRTSGLKISILKKNHCLVGLLVVSAEVLTKDGNHASEINCCHIRWYLAIQILGSTGHFVKMNLLSGRVFLKVTRWWFQIFFIFTPTWGRFPIWRAYFLKGLKPPTRKWEDSAPLWPSTPVVCLKT